MRRKEANIVTGKICLLVLLAVGCSNDANEKTSGPEDQTASKSAPESTHVPGSRLVGNWYGKATLDQAKLIQKLDSISDPQQRDQLEAIAQIFLTTEIGARFSADGQMGMEVEIRPGGQTIRDSTTGVWSVVSETDNAIMIETQEQGPGGGVETTQSRYQFVDGGAYALMVAPAADELADCNPLFVFEKAVLNTEPNERIAEGAAAAKK